MHCVGLNLVAQVFLALLVASRLALVLADSVIVQDIDSAITYDSTWKQILNGDNLDGSEHATLIPGGTATYNFTGTSITFFGVRHDDGAKFILQVDGSETPCSCWANQTYWTFNVNICSMTGLDGSKKHQLTMRHADTSGLQLAFDYFSVETGGTYYSSTTSPATSSTSAPVQVTATDPSFSTSLTSTTTTTSLASPSNSTSKSKGSSTAKGAVIGGIVGGVCLVAAGFVFCFGMRYCRRQSAKHSSLGDSPSPPNMAGVGFVSRPENASYEHSGNGIMQVLESGQVQADGRPSWSSPLSGYPGLYLPFGSPIQPTAMPPPIVHAPIPTRLSAPPPPSVFSSATFTTPMSPSTIPTTYSMSEGVIHGGSSSLYTSNAPIHHGSLGTSSHTNIGNISLNTAPSIQTNSSGGTSVQVTPLTPKTPLRDPELLSSADESTLGSLPPPRARRYRALPNLWPNSRRSGAGGALTRESSSASWSPYHSRSPPPRMELVSPAPPSYRTGMDTPRPPGT